MRADQPSIQSTLRTLPWAGTQHALQPMLVSARYGYRDVCPTLLLDSPWALALCCSERLGNMPLWSVGLELWVQVPVFCFFLSKMKTPGPPSSGVTLSSSEMVGQVL